MALGRILLFWREEIKKIKRKNNNNKKRQHWIKAVHLQKTILIFFSKPNCREQPQSK